MVFFTKFELLQGVASAIAFGFIYYYINMYTNMKHEGVNLTIAWFSAWFISKLIIRLVEYYTDIERTQKQDFLYNEGYDFIKDLYLFNEKLKNEV